MVVPHQTLPTLHRRLDGLSERSLASLISLVGSTLERLASPELSHDEFDKLCLLIDGLDVRRLRDELRTRRAEKLGASR